MRPLVLCAAALISLASATQSAYKAPDAPAPPGVSDADLYAATVRVFTDRGYELRDKDADAGVVSTAFVEVDNTLDFHTLHSWRAVIAEGTLRLAIDCEKRHEGRIDGCGESRVDDWIKDEPVLRQEIFDEAARRAKKRAHAAPAAETPPAETADAGAD